MNYKIYHRFSITVLIYNLLVILWGAFVRASGSGAGCGSHWPLCNGEVIPRAAQMETFIEFTHRMMSGLTLLLVIGLVIGAYRIYSRGSNVRFAAGMALFFTITEALVGAGLVLFGLTAQNDSVARAVIMAVHLVNTNLLLAFLTLTAFWSGGGKPWDAKQKGSLLFLVGIGLFLVLMVGASGAITALGDTLFPAGSLVEGFTQDFSPAAHFLVRLRVYHPVVAVLTSACLIIGIIINRNRPVEKLTRRLAKSLIWLNVLQLVIGVINVLLLAPISVQLIHLLVNDLLWINLVLLLASL